MNIEEYKTEVMRTIGNGNDQAWALGLVGEAGECADLIKKLHYHGGFDSKGPITPERILNESGDVLWYLVAFLNHFGYSLEECMQMNVKKLRKRHPNGFTFETAKAHADEHAN